MGFDRLPGTGYRFSMAADAKEKPMMETAIMRTRPDGGVERVPGDTFEEAIERYERAGLHKAAAQLREAADFVRAAKAKK